MPFPVLYGRPSLLVHSKGSRLHPAPSFFSMSMIFFSLESVIWVAHYLEADPRGQADVTRSCAGTISVGLELSLVLRNGSPLLPQTRTGYSEGRDHVPVLCWGRMLHAHRRRVASGLSHICTSSCHCPDPRPLWTLSSTPFALTPQSKDGGSSSDVALRCNGYSIARVLRFGFVSFVDFFLSSVSVPKMLLFFLLSGAQ